MSEVSPVPDKPEVKPRPIASLTFVLASESVEKKQTFIPAKPKLDPKTGKNKSLGHGTHVQLQSYTYKLKATDGVNGIEGHPVVLTLSGVKSLGWAPGKEVNVDIWEA